MSLFNPAVWIGFLLSLAASFGFGYYKGGIDEYLKQQAEITRLNDEARQKEQALVTAVQTQATQLVKAEQNAKVLSQKRNTDIDSGALKLRIPVKTPICPIQTTDHAPIAPRDSVQANAELDRETAKTLIAITDDGDKAIRQLNSCIDAYNAVYQTLKGNP
jgi:ATPase subunit of ABC transporter with duplicated ATPase domains